MNNPTGSNPWRDKYRLALGEQEKLEQQLSALQKVISRTIIEMSRAAEGRDPKLDERLQAIRASAKKNDVAGFERMLSSLARVVDEAKERETKNSRVLKNLLGDVASGLHKLKPEAELKSAIKQFKKQLPEGARLKLTLQKQIEQLLSLQQQALDAIPGEGKGLIRQLFSKKDSNSVQEEDASKQEPAVVEIINKEDWEEGEFETLEVEIEVDAISDDVSETDIAIEEDPTLYRNRPLPESMLGGADHPTLVDVPKRATHILLELINNIRTVEAVTDQSQQIQQKFDQGIQLYQLAPALEHVRDIVLVSFIHADENYRDYLSKLHDDLNHLLEAIGLSAAQEDKVHRANEDFSQSVRTGLSNIKTALQQQEEQQHQTDQLKQILDQQLEQLQQALVKQESVQEELRQNEQTSLSQQLQQLMKKVEAMEAKEKTISAELDAEKQRAITDSLTGLPNREAWTQASFSASQHWKNTQEPLTLAVIDIDFFKKINDNYGHATGDKVLQVVAKFLSTKLRSTDFIARFGGEEFVLLFIDTDSEKTLAFLNRVREKLAKTPLKYQNEKLNITVSIGISSFAEGDTTDSVFVRADEALYEAKENGRNQCRVK